MMHGALTLLRHSLGGLRGLLLALAAVVALFQTLLVRVARALEASAGFGGVAALVPPFLRQLAGEALFSLLSFPGIVCLGYFHPMIIAALCGMVIAAATEPAAEIETRFLDAALSRPVPRQAIIARSVAIVLLLPAVLLAAMLAGTAVGLRWLAPPGARLPDVRLLASLAANLWALLVCVGGWALAVGAASRRRSVAGSIAGVATLVLFLLDYLARAWKPADAIAWLSPFHYYRAMELLLGRPLDLSHLAVLLAAGAAGMVVAAVVFERRDL
ncbi:MAG TPA: ABC transporter permease subunit [Candidatus Methanoperedens sp.]|nr:ABC transporter permease subunit [Candidatus Methanoperedens sp.]